MSAVQIFPMDVYTPVIATSANLVSITATKAMKRTQTLNLLHAQVMVIGFRQRIIHCHLLPICRTISANVCFQIPSIVTCYLPSRHMASNNVELMSIRRRYVVSTSVRCQFDVINPLDIHRTISADVCFQILL